MVRPLHIKNAWLWEQNQSHERDLYMTDVILESPASDSLVVDLEGYLIYPGLINAHDHLELNHYPRSKFREVYDNAHQWGEDMSAQLDSSPYKELRAYPLWDRLFIGGLKNLLCGATTVAHHNPPHKALFRKDFPVRVLKQYGWAHSLHFSTDEEIVASYKSTPQDIPWFIHLAEGTDEVAASEYQHLKALGCIGSNTVLVHGVGLTDEDIADAAPRVRGLVWCPSTNRYLLDRIVTPYLWLEHGGTFALGSDSRLTIDGDLRLELMTAEMRGTYSHAAATRFAAKLLGIADAGHLRPGAQADWYLKKPKKGINFRPDIALIVKGGIPPNWRSGHDGGVSTY